MRLPLLLLLFFTSTLGIRAAPGGPDDQNPVFLAESDWMLRMNQENNPDITFHQTSEFKTEMV